MSSLTAWKKRTGGCCTARPSQFILIHHRPIFFYRLCRTLFPGDGSIPNPSINIGRAARRRAFNRVYRQTNALLDLSHLTSKQTNPTKTTRTSSEPHPQSHISYHRGGTGHRPNGTPPGWHCGKRSHVLFLDSPPPRAAPSAGAVNCLSARGGASHHRRSLVLGVWCDPVGILYLYSGKAGYLQSWGRNVPTSRHVPPVHVCMSRSRSRLKAAFEAISPVLEDTTDGAIERFATPPLSTISPLPVNHSMTD